MVGLVQGEHQRKIPFWIPYAVDSIKQWLIEAFFTVHMIEHSALLGRLLETWLESVKGYTFKTGVEI